MMNEPKYESEFLQLVMGLQGSAWMLLGKIANPMTGTQEKNLEAAKSVIDTLLMLKEKTKGNLSKAEESLLNGAIQQLEFNYLDELKTDNSIDEKSPPEETGQQENKPTENEKAKKKTSPT